MLSKAIQVSCYKNYQSVESTTVNLWDWLKNPLFRKKIDYLRSISENKEEKDYIKSTLPCITPSGLFAIRKEIGLLDHSGLICADIDAKDNPCITDFPKLRDQLANIVNVAYSSLSTSGKGVFCLIPIRNPEQHKPHFEALKRDFEHLGIIIDKSCGDISRLRIFSYDSEAYLNLNAVPYESIVRSKLQIPRQEVRPQSRSAPYDEKNSEIRVSAILYEIEAGAIDLTETYEQWFQIGCALANEFGEYGREMFHRVSRYYTKYNDSETNKMFNSCLNGSYRYSLGTFFYWAEQYNLK